MLNKKMAALYFNNLLTLIEVYYKKNLQIRIRRLDKLYKKVVFSQHFS